MGALALPFDQYQRYRLAADLVERVRPAERPLTVLDVGGRTGLLRLFLPRDRVILVDLEASGEPDFVLGDGCALPFRERCFDVVATFDTLEHVPPKRRELFVRECARVSRAYVFLAGPYASPEVDQAEELLRAFLEQKLGQRHRYLEEHRAHGLPSLATTECGLRALGASVQSLGHGNLERWLALMCMELYLDADPLLRPLAPRFFRFYNELLYPCDHAQPVYRHVVCAALAGAPLPDLTNLLADARAPAGSTSALQALAAELVAFDREQDLWRPELRRLERIIRDLEADLQGHRARLRDREEDLEQHRRSLADHRRDLEVERQERAAERAALLANEAALRRGLAESQEVQQATVEHLRRTESGALSIQAELLAARAELERMAATLGEREGQLARLRAALRSRLGNWQRALSFRPPELPS